MTTNHIKFKKQRELGEIISDTFKFIRENYKPLSKIIFKVTAPVLLIIILALTYNTYLMGGNLETPFFELFGNEGFGLFFISLFVLLFGLLAFYVLLHGVILHYINAYIKYDDQIPETEVYAGIKNDFPSLLALLLLASLVTFFGLLLFLVPGIYLWVPLSLAPMALIIGRYSLFESVGAAFRLIQNNWWNTFLSLIVILLLMYIISFIFKVPMFIYMIIKTITMAGEGSLADLSSMVDGVYIALNVIAAITQYLLSSIVIIAMTFVYFNLNEKKNFTGTYETISKLGTSKNE